MMYRLIYASLIAIATLFLASCSSAFKQNAKASYNSEKGTISISLENLSSCNYIMKINDYEIGNGDIKDKSELNILGKIKSKANILKDIALLAAKNNNELKVSLSLTDVLDTVFTYRMTPTVTMSDDNVRFTGVGAKVVSKSESKKIDDELKRWLYRKHEVVSESLYSSLRTNYLYLSKTKDNEFFVTGEIPVIHSLVGNMYSVNCNMIADYYAVVACYDQSFIDKFVENSVVKDYKNLSLSKTNIPCVCDSRNNGYKCLILLGINKDYSYQQIPFAVVAIDNEAPTYDYAPSIFKKFEFKDGTKVNMPDNAPYIYGGASVRVLHWDGNGLEANVTFEVLLIDDAKSATIHRRGELCNPSLYTNSSTFPVEDKTFYAKDGYKHIFTWKMHFNDGDNEIPVTVEDYHGNKRDYNVIERAAFVRNNSPKINIDNNIDIYN